MDTDGDDADPDAADEERLAVGRTNLDLFYEYLARSEVGATTGTFEQFAFEKGMVDLAENIRRVQVPY